MNFSNLSRSRRLLLGTGTALTVLSNLALGAEKPTVTKRPNVLFIPVDDLKPLLNCYGDGKAITPNIDRLAKQGTIFLNAQCQQAICGPSRASIMTGLYPDTTKVYDLKTKMRDVTPDILTIPQYFKQQGYQTTGVGKTFDVRCVDKDKDKPSWSIPYSKSGIYNSKYPRPDYGYQKPETRAIRKKLREEKGKSKLPWEKLQSVTPGAKPPTECYDVPDDAYADGAIARKGMQLMERFTKEGKPFFLSVGFLKPHLPFVAPKKYWDLYGRDKIEIHPFQKLPKNGVQVALQPGWELRGMYSDVPKKGPIPEPLQRELIHGYYASVSYMDAQVGKLLDKLDELGIADNTIICLWGDHGWHLGDHGMWCKHSNFEQAVRAPLIISAPGIGKKGTAPESPVGFVDVFPTLCELAGLDVPAQLQGVSLLPMLKDPDASVKEVQMAQYPRHRHMGYTLRSKTHRYVAWIEKSKLKDKATANTPEFEELYDYVNDPQERVNLAADPESEAIIARLREQLPEAMKHGGME